MNPLGLEYLTVYGCHPLDYIRMAADLGYAHVSLMTRKLDFPGMPPHAPVPFEEPALRREMLALLADRGVSIGLIDGFSFHRDMPAPDFRAMLDIVAELGVGRINCAATVELGRAIDGMGRLAELAAQYGVLLTVEAIPTFTIGDLPTALHVIDQVANPNFKLLIDTMHIARTGGAALLATIDPALIGYAQICDGPAGMPSGEVYFDQALHQREIPGEGELPLVDMMACIPAGIIASAEVPLRSLRAAGVSDRERARLVAEGSRQVLAAAAAVRRRAV
jgi:sugar phosphate isomerase/epimerase